MPSTSSSSFSSDLPSSTVITPSLPTFSMASAMILPTSLSRLAEIDPICATSLDELQGREIFFSSSTTAVPALSMPRLRSIGFIPEATYFIPSRTIAFARTVALVVPSPATSDVLVASSFSLCPDVLTRLFSEQHPVSNLDVERHELAFVGPLSLADRRDLALVGLLGRGVRYDDARRGLLLLVKTLDDYAIV